MSELPLYQQRVAQEYEDLFKKTTALGLFFGSQNFKDLDPAEQGRLNKQWQIMQQYGLVLSERISNFR